MRGIKMKQLLPWKKFCLKKAVELEEFCRMMLRKTKEDMFNSANEIDSKVCIYELLVEESLLLSNLVIQECKKVVSSLCEKRYELSSDADEDNAESLLQFLNELNERT